MALKNLDDNEMLVISGAWLDPERGRPALERHPVLAGMLPAIDAAHHGLIVDSPRTAESAYERERKRLYEEGVGLDRKHDSVARGIFGVLTSLAELCTEPADADALLVLRDAMFPAGKLDVIQASWRAEAGNAKRVHHNVLGDKGYVAALKAIPLPGKRTLLDAVKDFVAAGEALDTIEDERAAHEAQKPAAAPSAKVTTLKARNRWIAIANSVVSLSETVLLLTGDERTAVLGRLLSSEEKADARAQKPTARPPAPAPTPAPTP